MGAGVGLNFIIYDKIHFVCVMYKSETCLIQYILCRDLYCQTVTENENDASRQSENQSEQILLSDQ